MTISGSGGATGAYNFILEDAPKSTPIALTSGAGTAESSQSLASGLATNLYQISGAAGQRLYFQALAQSAGPSDLQWTLYGPSGNSIAGTPSGFSGSWTDFAATLPTDGTYYLAVTGTNSKNTSVTYNFEVYDNVNPITALAFGQEVAGTIQNPGDEASYTFTGAVGQTLFFGGLEHVYNSITAQLIAPNGITEEYLYPYQNSLFTLPVGGVYTLTVSGSGKVTGAYDFALYDAQDAPAIALTSGAGTAESSQSLAWGTATNLYRIGVTAGQRLDFQALAQSAGPSDLQWTLYGPNGNTISSPYYGSGGSWADFTATLPADGTDFLAVTGTNAANTSVTYNFEVYDNVVNPSDAPLKLGQEVSGNVTNPGDQASYTFAGTAGQIVYFDGLDVNGFEAILTDPAGNDLFDTDTSLDDGPIVLPDSGSYILTISSVAGSSTSSYHFVLDDAATATSISLPSGSGVAVAGSLGTGLSTQLYRFSGTTGERLDFQALEPVSGTDRPGMDALRAGRDADRECGRHLDRLRGVVAGRRLLPSRGGGPDGCQRQR